MKFKVGDRVIVKSNQLTVFGERPEWNGIITDILLTRTHFKSNMSKKILYEVKRESDDKEVIGNFFEDELTIDTQYYRNTKLTQLLNY